MYKWLNQLGYSPMVVKYMSGLNENTIYEIKNEEGCEQLAEGYNWLKTPKQKQNYLDFHMKIESDIQEWLKNNKIVRKKRIQTPAQKVKKLNYLQSGEGLTSIDPVEIIRETIYIQCEEQKVEVLQFIWFERKRHVNNFM